jgi:hypothetical protein
LLFYVSDRFQSTTTKRIFCSRRCSEKIEYLLFQMNLFFSSVEGEYLLLDVIFFSHRRYFFLHKRIIFCKILFWRELVFPSIQSPPVILMEYVTLQHRRNMSCLESYEKWKSWKSKVCFVGVDPTLLVRLGLCCVALKWPQQQVQF